MYGSSCSFCTWGPGYSTLHAKELRIANAKLISCSCGLTQWPPGPVLTPDGRMLGVSIFDQHVASNRFPVTMKTGG